MKNVGSDGDIARPKPPANHPQHLANQNIESSTSNQPIPQNETEIWLPKEAFTNALGNSNSGSGVVQGTLLTDDPTPKTNTTDLSGLEPEVARVTLMSSNSVIIEESSVSKESSTGSKKTKDTSKKKKGMGCFSCPNDDETRFLIGLPPPIHFAEDGEARDFRESLQKIRNALLHAQRYAPGYAIERSSVHNSERNENMTDLVSTAASHDAPTSKLNTNTTSPEKSKSSEIDDPEVDNDVPTLLEQMNEACANINQHEQLLSQAQKDHKRTLDDWSSCIEAWKVQLQDSGLRKCTHFAEAVENMHGIHMALHNAVRNFSRATARVDEAREELTKAEAASKSPAASPHLQAATASSSFPSRENSKSSKPLPPASCSSSSVQKEGTKNSKMGSRQGSRQLDLVSSEAVASAVVSLQEATLERDRLHQVHKKKIADYDTARNEVAALKNKYGKLIERARPFLTMRREFMRKLRREKETVALEAQKLRRSKELYVKAMQDLEKISDNIHQRRSLRNLKNIQQENE